MICFQAAVEACAGNPPGQGRGPLMDVLRIWVDRDGVPLPDSDWPAGSVPGPSGWQILGNTCLPNLVPGADRVPTVEMITEVFHETTWAKAVVATQPEGNKTLVNLPTFYRLEWSESGFGPGEVDSVDPARMFGYRVQIRPKLVSVVWRFGDGSTFGPTTSQGGVWPDGEVQHVYRDRGTFVSSVVIRFGADFRINGGGWVPLPETVDVTQPGTAVTVQEARAVLVNE